MQMCVCLCVYIYSHTHTYTHTSTKTLHMHSHAHAHAHVHVHVHVHACVCVRVIGYFLYRALQHILYLLIHVYIYTHIFIGARKYLPQTSHTIEDTLRYARQSVGMQTKDPVSIAEMSGRMHCLAFPLVQSSFRDTLINEYTNTYNNYK